MLSLFVQNVLKPFSAAIIDIKRSEVKNLLTFQTPKDFYTALKGSSFSDTLKRIYVNVGPGSYTGIRTSLAYVRGVIVGAKIKGTVLEVKSYTSFDFTCSDFILGYPKCSGINDEALGYFKSNSEEIKYLTYAEAKKLNPNLRVFNECDSSENLISSEFILNFIKVFNFGEALKPLYINPVRIG